jgi:geranylgeranyl pyrophosphate synthase
VQGQNLAQEAGKVITYLRRYSLAAIIGLTQKDNDAAQDKPKQKPKKVDYTDSIQAINECGSMAELGALWSELSAPAHKALEQVKNDAKARLAA